jgi:DNA-directed RNA polymerase subunit RPC12/RpoP
MKTGWKWVLIGIAVFLLAFLFALPFFTGICGRAGSMMGGGWSGWNMMGGGYPMMGFGSLMMVTIVLAPLLLIALVAAAVIALQRNSRSTSETPTAPIACPHCGKTVQKEWVACPHCGQKL